LILPVLSPEWKTGLSLAWSGYIAVLAVWIILQKRAPVSTLSWILSMALLPFAGYVVYYFFGPQRLKKQRLKRLRSQASPVCEADFAHLRDAAANAPASLQQLVQLGTASCELPISTATRVDLLVGGAETFDAIFEAIRAARHHVHLEYYIFEPDHIGTALRDLLVDQGARRACRCACSSTRWARSGWAAFLAPLHAAGAQVGAVPCLAHRPAPAPGDQLPHPPQDRGLRRPGGLSASPAASTSPTRKTRATGKTPTTTCTCAWKAARCGCCR
jgi:cardiolipin synthase